MVQQAGDSMHVSVVGAVILWLTAYTTSLSSVPLALQIPNPCDGDALDDDDAGSRISRTPLRRFKSSASIGGNSVNSAQPTVFDSALLLLSNQKREDV